MNYNIHNTNNTTNITMNDDIGSFQATLDVSREEIKGSIVFSDRAGFKAERIVHLLGPNDNFITLKRYLDRGMYDTSDLFRVFSERSIT